MTRRAAITWPGTRGDYRADGFTFEYALTGQTGKDWDDLYRLRQLTPEFMAECLYRGRVHFAKTVKEKAYWWYTKAHLHYGVLHFNNRFYAITVDDGLGKELARAKDGNKYNNKAQPEDGGEGPQEAQEAPQEKPDVLFTEEGKSLFLAACSAKSISNCLPKFLYCEINKFNGTLAYYFDIHLPHRKASVQTAFTGAALECAKSFNKALLSQSPGSSFDGSDGQLKRIRENWFGQGVRRVETLPFIGYDRDSGVYVYPAFGYQQGRELAVNDHGFIDTGKHQLKTLFRSINIEHGRNFDASWLPAFHSVFADNGMLALAFWFGGLFAEQIRAELKSYPFLELTGEYASGKSTLLGFLWKLIGRDDYEGFGPRQGDRQRPPAQSGTGRQYAGGAD